VELHGLDIRHRFIVRHVCVHHVADNFYAAFTSTLAFTSILGTMVWALSGRNGVGTVAVDMVAFYGLKKMVVAFTWHLGHSGHSSVGAVAVDMVSFYGLKKMLVAFTSTLGTMAWALLLLMLMIYGFAVLFTTGVSDCLCPLWHLPPLWAQWSPLWARFGGTACSAQKRTGHERHPRKKLSHAWPAGRLER